MGLQALISAGAARRLIPFGVLAAVAGGASAQTGPPPAPTPPSSGEPNTTKPVTVTAAPPPPVRTSIDRRSYDITKDLQAQTGTLADALRDVPQLTVDLQGNVSIRGDSNVVIMVDGKPSTQFQGSGRATALQSLPADDYERVEVITNPTAAFSPEGTAGIVNLISKRSRKPGDNGTLRANADPTGRWNTQLSASRKTNKLTLSFSAGVRHDLSFSSASEARAGLAQPGVPAFSSFETTGAAGGQYAGNVRGGLDYDPDSATRLSAAVHYGAFGFGQDVGSQTLTDDDAGQLEQILNRFGRIGATGNDLGLDSSVRRTFGRDDHDLSVSLVVERNAYNVAAPYADVSPLPALPEVFDDRDTRTTYLLTDLKADYERPMPNQGKFKAGYELKIEDDGQSNVAFLGAASPAGPFDPAEADAFRFSRWINALYATYEQPIGKLTILPGLRLERTDLKIDDRTADIQAGSGDWRLYPTLHLAYALSGGQQLSASYGERVQRPGPQDFNPYRIVVSPFEIRTGNPNLQPQVTQDFELAWDDKRGSDYLRVGLYYKINTGGVDNAITDLGDGVFLYTRENLDSSRNGGGELEASGRIGKTITYNLSSALTWSQIDASTFGLPAPRSLFSANGKAVISWQATPRDMVQLYVWGSGRSLTAEGYLNPWAAASIGYRHKFNDKLSMFATLQDVLASDRFGSTVFTPTLTDRSVSNPHARVLFLGLAYSFGAGPKRDQAIELTAPGGQ